MGALPFRCCASISSNWLKLPRPYTTYPTILKFLNFIALVLSRKVKGIWRVGLHAGDEGSCTENAGRISQRRFYQRHFHPVVEDKPAEVLQAGGIKVVDITDAAADDDDVGVQQVGDHR